MKLLLFIILILSVCHLEAQIGKFEESLELVQQKIKCCSLPISASSEQRADSILADKNGNLIIRFSDPSNEGFELFKILPQDNTSTKIDSSKNTIIFFSGDNELNRIRFSNSAAAEAVYNALSYLSSNRRQEEKMFGDLDFQQTVDVINIRLGKWSEKSDRVKILALKNGIIIVINKEKQTLKFNLFDLKDEFGEKVLGIETNPCDPRTHAPSAWINFKSVLGTIGFIRLDCSVPNEELNIIRNAFMHLRSLSSNFSAITNPPYEAVYFISRLAKLESNDEMLDKSIRSSEMTSFTGKATTANGEGWLDRDSLPIGIWNFYIQESSGKEYLFKTGTYKRTKPGMFEVTGIDSTELAKRYHLTFTELQRGHVQTIPFIKVQAWSYYYPNGKLWKSVYFRDRKIPLSVIISMADPEQPDATRLLVSLKERMDEWPEED